MILFRTKYQIKYKKQPLSSSINLFKT